MDFNLVVGMQINKLQRFLAKFSGYTYSSRNNFNGFYHSVLFSHSACTAPNDYMALNSMLVFTVGQSVGDMACTNLDIVDNMVVERDGEDVILSLSPVEPAVTVVTASSATVAIIENDNDGKLNIVLVRYYML